jgi:hypothetical protein
MNYFHFVQSYNDFKVENLGRILFFEINPILVSK